MKECKVCKKEKPATSFYTDRGYSRSSCKECDNRKRKENYYKTPYNPNAKLIKEYGISLSDYNILFDSQEGKCKICGRHQIEFKRRLAVDHDHKTGKVRGLLCSHCNLMLGHAQDKQEILQRAMEYLNGI